MCKLYFVHEKNVSIALLFILMLIVRCQNFASKLEWYDCSQPDGLQLSLDSHAINNCAPVIESLSNSGYNDFSAVENRTNLPFSITLWTSHTKNIEIYSNYSLLINQLYAHLHGYHLISIVEAKYTTNSTYDKDSRWNKIKYLAEYLENQSNLLNSDHYIIWLDADLAIVNFDFDFTTLISSYPDAHIIMSRDKADAPFVGNTGCIIIRNTHWSIDFLQLWWSAYDRNRCCDQNALTWLYDRLVPHDIREKLLFLPANIINTDFPAYVNDSRYLNLLHLAGVNSLFRRRVFRDGLVNVCTTLTASHQEDSKQTIAADYPALLGLNYRYLQYVVQDLDRARLCALHILTDNMHSATTIDLPYLDDIRSVMNDIMKYDDDEATFTVSGANNKHEIESQVFVINTWLNRQLFHLAEDTSLDCNMRSEECKLSLEVIREAVTSSFELILSLPVTADSPSDLLDTFHATLNRARELVDFVLENVSQDIIQSRFLYYRFKCVQLLADITSYRADINVHIDHLISAASIWRELTSKYRYYGTEYVLADPHKEFMELLVRLGVILCEHERQDEGILAFQEAAVIQREMITGYDAIRLATESIIKRGHVQLAEILFNLAVCASSSSASSYASRRAAEVNAWLEESMNVLKQIGAENDTLAYEQARNMLDKKHGIVEIGVKGVSDKQQQPNHGSNSEMINKRFRKKKRAK